MTRYEWATREIMKWDAIRRAHGDNSDAGKCAYDIRLSMYDYRISLTTEEAAEVMPEEEAE